MTKKEILEHNMVSVKELGQSRMELKRNVRDKSSDDAVTDSLKIEIKE